MPRVVDELEVDVRVVDGRVASERIVRDVERVVRAGGDRQPRLVRGVEDRRRDLADAAAEAGLELAVDDHRRLEEALRRGALAGRAVERERRAGRDQLAVDEVGDELDVVDPVRVAAVDRLVASPTVPVMPIACAAAVVRCGCADVTRACATRFGRPLRRGEDRAPPSVARRARRPGVPGRRARCRSAFDREVGVRGARSTVCSRRAKYASAAGPASRDRRARGSGAQDLREPPTRDAQARRPGDQVTGAAITCDRRAAEPERATPTVTLGGSTRDRQRDRRTRERRERTDEQRPGAATVEHTAGLARSDRDVQTAADELRLAMRRVDRLRR